MTMPPIATVRSEFGSKFGIPRQSGLARTRARVEFMPDYRDPNLVRGLDGFSHVWLIWGFSMSGGTWHPTVRPPRLGGERRVGVFASRSPFRPNPLGLSSVELLHVGSGFLDVAGADLADGTPIYDIKPYVAADCHPNARLGFTTTPWPTLAVEISEELSQRVPNDRIEVLRDVLAQDPRPAYQDDPHRRYGFCFAGLEVKFHVDGRTLVVDEISKA